MTPALLATDLVAGYHRRRRRRPIVSVARLAAGQGELTAVVGPNGGGKTTLLRTLVGAQQPLSGRVEIGGRPLAGLGRQQRARHLAVVLTDRVDPGRLSVGEVVALGRHPHTGWTGHLTPGDVDAARDAATRVGVADLWDEPFDQLSDGQRQRVLVARALAQDPTLIVLDEPTAHLDLPARAALTAGLARLTRHAPVAVIVSTHDLDLALGHADRLWLVHDAGVTVGAPEDLLHNGALAAAFSGDGLWLDPATATMRTEPTPGPTVAVHGDGLPAQLATRVVRRVGLATAEAGWDLRTTSAGWTLRCGRHEHTGGDFGQLAHTLRHLTGPEEPS